MSVATAVTTLETVRDTKVAELAAIGADGPNFSLDGVGVEWQAYAISLREEIMNLTIAIEQLKGPCIVYTQGR